MEQFSDHPPEEREALSGLTLPGERPLAYFLSGDRVVVLAPVTNTQSQLKRGEVSEVADGGRRVAIELDCPIRAEVKTFSVNYDQPFVMKETEYRTLRDHPELVPEWVASGYSSQERSRRELAGKIAGIGVFEGVGHSSSHANKWQHRRRGRLRRPPR